MPTAQPAAPAAHPATFIWTDPAGTGRNVFAQFRRSVRLTAVPKKAELHLFADTRYRLCVNGQVAGYGPARFVPHAPEYDTVDIAPYLKKGANEITVEVNHFGASSFESVPSIGGFIAWGAFKDAAKTIDLSTPGTWRARPGLAWDPWAPPYSFAQSPVEIVKLHGPGAPLAHRLPDSAGWAAPVPLANQAHWGKLLPRSMPNLSLETIDPTRVLVLGPLAEREERISYRLNVSVNRPGGYKWRTLFATHLYSPTDQDVTLALFWGPYYLNGTEIQPLDRNAVNNRRAFAVTLKQGWNFLYGAAEVLADSWGQLIGWPAGKGILARAEPREDCPEVLRHTGPIERAEYESFGPQIPTSLADLPEVTGGWTAIPDGASGDLPAREMAWDTVEPSARDVAKPEQVRELQIPLNSRGAGTVLVDFGGEFIGHAVVDITAPAGTIIDIANEEKLRQDGLLEWFTHWMVNSADRFLSVHPDQRMNGRQTFEAFHPRGGRYMNLTVRNATGPVTLHSLTVRRTMYPARQEGRFVCSDPVLTWAYQAGVDTMVGSMEDAYVDPWRERGVYLGDTLVEAHVVRRFTPDERMTRRCLWLWGVGQRDDGQIQDVVPSWHTNALPDYTFIWVIMLFDYWAATGDVALVKQMWPHVTRVFESTYCPEAESGLLDGTGKHVFVDWGTSSEAKQGENGVLNAFRYGALVRAARLAKVIRNPKAAATYEREARRVKKAYQILWDDKEGRYAALRKDGQLALEIPSPHATVVALLYGLAEKKQAQRGLSYVLEHLGDTYATAKIRMELYFLYYALLLLMERGEAAAAEQTMRECWGYMKHHGAWAVWETLERGKHNVGSMCHGWAAAPTVLLMERTLGVRPAVEGKDTELVFEPETARVTWARGTYPHRLGGVEVEWRLEAGRVLAKVKAPRGVKVRVAKAAVVGGTRVPVVAE